MCCLPWVDKRGRPSFLRHLVTSPQPGMAAALQSGLWMPAIWRRCCFPLVFSRTSRLCPGVLWAHTAELCGLAPARAVLCPPPVRGVPRGPRWPWGTQVHLAQHQAPANPVPKRNLSSGKVSRGETHLGSLAPLSPTPAPSTVPREEPCHKPSPARAELPPCGLGTAPGDTGNWGTMITEGVCFISNTGLEKY